MNELLEVADETSHTETDICICDDNNPHSLDHLRLVMDSSPVTQVKSQYAYLS